MLARHVNLFQVAVQVFGGRLLHGQVGISDNGVHGRADIVAHVEQELALGKAPFYGADFFTFHQFVLFADLVLHIQHNHQPDKDNGKEHDAGKYQHVAGNFVGGFCIQELCHPHDGGIQEQGEQHHARDGHAAVFGEGTPANGAPVKDKAQQAPQRQEQEGCRTHGFHGGKPGHKLHHHEDNGYDSADTAGHTNFGVVFGLCDFPGRSRHVAEPYNGAEGCQVHEPVQRVSAQKRKHNGNDHDEQDAVGGLRESVRKDTVFGHGGKDAHDGAVTAYKPGQDGGNGSDSQDHKAKGSHNLFYPVENGHGNDPL